MSNLSHNLIRTRKPHQCYSCYRIFPERSFLYKWASIYEGDFCSGYTCETCQKIMDLDTENHSFESGYVHEGWISYKDGPKTPEEVLESFKKENELVWKK